MHLSTGLRGLHDPARALAEAVEVRQLADQLEAAAVRRARDEGWDWDRIAEALAQPRDEVRRRHGGGAGSKARTDRRGRGGGRAKAAPRRG